VRTALLAAMISVTACSTTTLTPDAAPRQLQLDVVVSDGSVTLYTNASDLAATGCYGQDVFPAPGTSASISDIVTCQQGTIDSCLTKVALVIAGTEIPAMIPSGRAIKMAGDVEGAGGGHLVIEGCGGSADITLPTAIVPQPTLTATVDTATRTITSTWSASPAAASALLVMNAGLWADVAHLTSSPYTFTVPTGLPVSDYNNVVITTFLPPSTAATVFGPVQIWSGASTTFSLR
jgi:hypothetical protein